MHPSDSWDPPNLVLRLNRMSGLSFTTGSRTRTHSFSEDGILTRVKPPAATERWETFSQRVSSGNHPVGRPARSDLRLEALYDLEEDDYQDVTSVAQTDRGTSAATSNLRSVPSDVPRSIPPPPLRPEIPEDPDELNDYSQQVTAWCQQAKDPRLRPAERQVSDDSASAAPRAQPFAPEEEENFYPRPKHIQITVPEHDKLHTISSLEPEQTSLRSRFEENCDRPTLPPVPAKIPLNNLNFGYLNIEPRAICQPDRRTYEPAPVQPTFAIPRRPVSTANRRRDEAGRVVANRQEVQLPQRRCDESSAASPLVDSFPDVRERAWQQNARHSGRKASQSGSSEMRDPKAFQSWLAVEMPLPAPPRQSERTQDGQVPRTRPHRQSFSQPPRRTANERPAPEQRPISEQRRASYRRTRTVVLENDAESLRGRSRRLRPQPAQVSTTSLSEYPLVSNITLADIADLQIRGRGVGQAAPGVSAVSDALVGQSRLRRLQIATQTAAKRAVKVVKIDGAELGEAWQELATATGNGVRRVFQGKRTDMLLGRSRSRP